MKSLFIGNATLLMLGFLSVGVGNASASIFSGLPTADGWLFGGDSLVTGASYVGGAPDNVFDGQAEYQLYSNATTLTSAFLTECGATCAAWQVGDTIIGLGAVFPTTVGGGNQDNTGYVILRWGVTGATYSLSNPYGAPIGNGNRDHDNGDGGLGSVMTTLNAPVFPGVATSGASTAFQWAGVLGNSGTDIQLGSYIAFKSIVTTVVPAIGDPYNVFSSFEGYLNVTRLNYANPLGSFTFNGNSIVGVRDGGPLATLETNALIHGSQLNVSASVPEPATGFLAAGVLLAGWRVRRRRS